ncbi:MAG TPA: hypothetical protein VLX90_04960 [Steroidobacteraceae bacterium]|nr:hypothetical protein [Steroidobacteraceae bacterium]
MAHRGRLLLRLVLLAGACGPAVAGDPKTTDPADIELLEFLGSVDSGADSQAAADDGSWIDYLAQTDIGKVAKTADPNGIPRAGQVATGTPPPASGDKKDD